MGKHSAADGAVVHPIVATALQQRGQAGAQPRPPLGAADAGSPVGWPQEPHRGEGIGWPTSGQPAPHDTHRGDTGPAVTAEDDHPEDDHPKDDGSVLAALDAAAAEDGSDEVEQAPTRRGGWRRLFGGGSTSAA
ncbi:hypothetical protein TEK04_00385 [Klenkia sp. LSe6-5]|uniref:Uncharacterized protein n=1 Tax=Klenkia sesuvii TaxID=3103137 RepID=A0ABU8DQ57_9ACTN